MKLTFVIFLVAIFAVVRAKKCTVDPLSGYPPCDNLKPGHCYPPVCGKNKSNSQWFKNSCYLWHYNAKCHTSYKLVSESLCDAKTKPPSPPAGHGQCPGKDNPGGFGFNIDW